MTGRGPAATSATGSGHDDADIGSSDTAPRLVWWHEIALVLVFYGVYTLVRNQFGSASVDSAEAYANARKVMDLERTLGILREASLQQAFLGAPWFLRFWNVFYGSLHFVVPIATLVFLYRRHPSAYPKWRNTIIATTAFALVGFSLYPLMPPRLLCDCPYGAGPGVDAGFVDTLARYGGLWSFGSSTVADISNQYAAMPSLHTAWALWAFLALLPRLRHTWSRILVALYPLVTIFAIVVTGNHFFLDAVAGAAVLGLGYLVGSRLANWQVHRRAAATANDQVPVRSEAPG